MRARGQVARSAGRAAPRLAAPSGRPSSEANGKAFHVIHRKAHLGRHDEELVEIIRVEIQVVRGNTTRTLMVRLSVERVDDRAVGYVITFDDITALQSAQRKARSASRNLRRIAVGDESSPPKKAPPISISRVKEHEADLHPCC